MAQPLFGGFAHYSRLLREEEAKREEVYQRMRATNTDIRDIQDLLGVARSQGDAVGIERAESTLRTLKALQTPLIQRLGGHTREIARLQALVDRWTWTD